MNGWTAASADRFGRKKVLDFWCLFETRLELGMENGMYIYITQKNLQLEATMCQKRRISQLGI
jgi:hypothetical protein